VYLHRICIYDHYAWSCITNVLLYVLRVYAYPAWISHQMCPNSWNVLNIHVWIHTIDTNMIVYLQSWNTEVFYVKYFDILIHFSTVWHVHTIIPHVTHHFSIEIPHHAYTCTCTRENQVFIRAQTSKQLYTHFCARPLIHICIRDKMHNFFFLYHLPVLTESAEWFSSTALISTDPTSLEFTTIVGSLELPANMGSLKPPSSSAHPPLCAAERLMSLLECALKASCPGVAEGEFEGRLLTIALYPYPPPPPSPVTPDPAILPVPAPAHFEYVCVFGDMCTLIYRMHARAWLTHTYSRTLMHTYYMPEQVQTTDTLFFGKDVSACIWAYICTERTHKYIHAIAGECVSHAKSRVDQRKFVFGRK